MLSFELDEIAGVLTVRPERKLEAQDFQALSEAVDPFIEEKVTIGLLFHVQALLLARHLRGDLEGYPPFLWK